MLCCTSVLSYLQPLGLGELFYAVLCCNLCSDLSLGLEKAALCCAVHLCCHLCSDQRP